MKQKPDVQACGGSPSWVYGDTVKEHFLNPQNLLIDEEDYESDGVGVVGSPTCGDMMIVWIKVTEDGSRIKKCKWRTFGCASSFASASMMSVMVTENKGMSLKDAKHLTPEAIIERLGGLPDQKYHCSVLGHLALRDAIEDYEKNKATG